MDWFLYDNGLRHERVKFVYLRNEVWCWSPSKNMPNLDNMALQQYLRIVCMFLSCHVRVAEWIHTLYLPECQRTPWSRREIWTLSDFNWTWTHNHLVRKHSTIWPVWPNGRVLVYKLSGCGFESSCSHLRIVLMLTIPIREPKWCDFGVLRGIFEQSSHY